MTPAERCQCHGLCERHSGRCQAYRGQLSLLGEPPVVLLPWPSAHKPKRWLCADCKATYRPAGQRQRQQRQLTEASIAFLKASGLLDD